MAWIELHQSVWTHRKTMLLGAALGIHDTYAAAHMARLWCWALDNAPNGDLSRMPDMVVARGAAWPGDACAFVSAMGQAGYLDEDRMLHDWPEYAGRLIAAREAERQRGAARRAAQKKAVPGGTTGGCPADDRWMSGGRPVDVQQTSVGTQPNPTVPNQENPPTPLAAGAAPVEDPRPPKPASRPTVPLALVEGGGGSASSGKAKGDADGANALAKHVYDELAAKGRAPADNGWMPRAIARIRKLTPAARAGLLEAVRQAIAPGEARFSAGWLTRCDFALLVDRYATGKHGPETTRAPTDQEGVWGKSIERELGLR